MEFIWLLICIVVILLILARAKKIKNNNDKKIEENKSKKALDNNLHKGDKSTSKKDTKACENKKTYDSSRKKNRGKNKDSKTKNLNTDAARDNIDKDSIDIKKSEDAEKYIKSTDNSTCEKTNSKTATENLNDKSSKNKVNEEFKDIINAINSSENLSLNKFDFKIDANKGLSKTKSLENEENYLNLSKEINKLNINNLCEFLSYTKSTPAILKRKDTISYEFTSHDTKDIENIIKRYSLDFNVDNVEKITSKLILDKESLLPIEIRDVITNKDHRFYFESKF